MNIDQVKPGPPERKTLSLPCLRLPELEPPREDVPLEATEQTAVETNMEHIGTDQGVPPTSSKYSLRPRPPRVAASSSDFKFNFGKL